MLSIGQCATVACLLEATTPKPGNVHRGADFEDLTFLDFEMAAVAITPAMEDATSTSLGKTVLAAVEATRAMVDTNVNLGLVLTIAPLASVPRDSKLSVAEVQAVLQALTPEDASCVYQAIELAQAGGLGEVEEMDVSEEPPQDLLAAMAHAEPWDRIAAQYVHGFADVLETILPWLKEAAERWSLTDGIILTFLRVLARWPDSLIGRKLGAEVAQEAADRAAAVIASGEPNSPDFESFLSDFDFWLRADGHRRNPGTTADLTGAALFAALRDGHLSPPFRYGRNG